MFKIYLSVFLILGQCYLANAQVLTIEPLLQSAQAGDRFQGKSVAIKGETSKNTNNKLNFTINIYFNYSSHHHQFPAHSLKPTFNNTSVHSITQLR